MARFVSATRTTIIPFALAAALLTGGATAATVAFGTTAALAQDQPAPAGPPAGASRGRMGKVLMSLGLSDAQKTQIRSIMADTRKQNENVTDRDVRRANYKAAMTKVETVLTPAQRSELHAKLDAMRQQDQNPHS